jgi:hypothetical protein
VEADTYDGHVEALGRREDLQRVKRVGAALVTQPAGS